MYIHGRRTDRYESFLMPTPYENVKQWRAANPERSRAQSLLAKEKRQAKKFGVSKPQAIAAQGGLCKLCGEPFDGSARGAKGSAMDHDHGTGKFRGVIHNRCNQGLFDLKHAHQAVAYLEASEPVVEYGWNGMGA